MVWTKTSRATKVKNLLYELIKERFDQENIEIPSPKITTHQE